jgi:lysophospholipase L1-like esterase
MKLLNIVSQAKLLVLLCFVCMFFTSGACGDESKTKLSDSGSYSSEPATSGKSYTIFCIGDSTMADYDTVTNKEQRGWCQLLPQYVINNKVTVVNSAINGRSARSFYVEGSWAKVKAQIQSGDYVLIQFAHNDEKTNGLEPTSASGLTSDTLSDGAHSLYQKYLQLYVQETKALGATPVLVGPIVRCSFDSSTGLVSEKGAHNLDDVTYTSIDIPVYGTSKSVTDDANYPEAMQEVATKESCTYIDLTAATRNFVNSFGSYSAVKPVVYLSSDDTHLQRMGASLFARLAVKEFLSAGLFSGDLNTEDDIIVNPVIADFGTRYLNRPLIRSFTIAGISVSSAASSMTITPPSGFSVCSSATGTFSSTLTFPVSGGRLTPDSFYVKFNPSAAQSYDGVMTVVTDNASNLANVFLKGSGVSFASGATETAVSYPLTSTISGTSSTSLVSCVDETVTGMSLNSYYPAAAYGWDTPSDSYLVQRLDISGSSWSSESALNGSRYIQFAITPSSGYSMTVDEISVFAGAAGGSSLRFALAASTSSDFSTSTTLVTKTSLSSNYLYKQSYTSNIVVKSGETLYLRVYPWSSSSASSLYLCLQNLYLHAFVQ